MRTIDCPPASARSSRTAFVPRVPLHRAASLLVLWYERHLQRHDLASLDAWMLGDLGLTPEEVRRECAKPFWR